MMSTPRSTLRCGDRRVRRSWSCPRSQHGLRTRSKTLRSLRESELQEAGASDKATADSTNKADAKAKATLKPEFIVKSPAEWRKILTRVQFAVTRGKATEPPFTGKYASGHFRGTFVCVCCDAAHVRSELFQLAGQV